MTLGWAYHDQRAAVGVVIAVVDVVGDLQADGDGAGNEADDARYEVAVEEQRGRGLVVV